MGWLKLASTALQGVPTVRKALKSAAIAGPGAVAVGVAVELGWLPADLSPATYAGLTALATWAINTIKLAVAKYVGTR